MAFSKLRARLGAARLVLAEVPEVHRATHSKLQSNAIEDMLKSNAKTLTPEEKADLARMVGIAKFSNVDETRLL